MTSRPLPLSKITAACLSLAMALSCSETTTPTGPSQPPVTSESEWILSFELTGNAQTSIHTIDEAVQGSFRIRLGGDACNRTTMINTNPAPEDEASTATNLLSARMRNSLSDGRSITRAGGQVARSPIAYITIDCAAQTFQLNVDRLVDVVGQPAPGWTSFRWGPMAMPGEPPNPSLVVKGTYGPSGRSNSQTFQAYSDWFTREATWTLSWSLLPYSRYSIQNVFDCLSACNAGANAFEEFCRNIPPDDDWKPLRAACWANTRLGKPACRVFCRAFFGPPVQH
jgi:hypothetical protein